MDVNTSNIAPTTVQGSKKLSIQMKRQSIETQMRSQSSIITENRHVRENGRAWQQANGTYLTSLTQLEFFQILGACEFVQQREEPEIENEDPSGQDSKKMQPELPNKQASERSKRCPQYPQALKPTLFDINALTSESTVAKTAKTHFSSNKHQNLDLK